MHKVCIAKGSCPAKCKPVEIVGFLNILSFLLFGFPNFNTVKPLFFFPVLFLLLK